LLDEARQGRGDDDYSSIARRFSAIRGKRRKMAERQPDLFSPRPAEMPHESPEFVEEQLAKTGSDADWTKRLLSPASGRRTGRLPKKRPKPADLETPRQTEPEPGGNDDSTRGLLRTVISETRRGRKRGFFSRLLRRTDY